MRSQHVSTARSRGRGRRALLRGAGIALAGSLALVGCSAAAPDAGDGGDATDDMLSMTFLSILTLDTLSLAPEMYADAAGLFEKHGVDVDIQVVQGSPVGMQGIVGGLGQLTRIGGIDVLTAAASGQELLNVGTVERGGGFRVVSAEDDPLEEMSDYDGKIIGVGSEGGTSTKTLTLALENAGVDPADVERQVVGLTSATFGLVEQGQLDGYMLGIDTAEMVADQFPNAVVSGEGLTAASDIQVYVTTAQQVEEHGEAISRYLAAIQEAIEFIQADESLDDTIATIQEKYSFASLDNTDVAKASIDAYRKVWMGDLDAFTLESDPARWQEAYDVLVDAEMTPAGGDPDSWLDNSLVPEVGQ